MKPRLVIVTSDGAGRADLDAQLLLAAILSPFFIIECLAIADGLLLRILRAKPDIIIVLPSLSDGPVFDLNRQIQSNPQLRNAPKVALTSRTAPGDRERYLEYFDHYQTIPIQDLDGFVTLIRSMVETRERSV